MFRLVLSINHSQVNAVTCTSTDTRGEGLFALSFFRLLVIYVSSTFRPSLELGFSMPAHYYISEGEFNTLSMLQERGTRQYHFATDFQTSQGDITATWGKQDGSKCMANTAKRVASLLRTAEPTKDL